MGTLIVTELIASILNRNTAKLALEAGFFEDLSC